MAPTIRAVLVDLSGTIHVGDMAVPGAVEAVGRLRHPSSPSSSAAPSSDNQREQAAPPLQVRFLTNTSTKSSSDLLEQLRRIGFASSSSSPSIIEKSDLVTSVLATRDYLLRNGMRPYCITEDATASDLDGVDLDPPHDSVVVGLAPTRLDYRHMNRAFRILLDNPGNLVAVHRANYVRDVDDGQLSLGPGGFVAALEAASGCRPATVVGKPSKAFFESAMWPDIPASETCMVGDDVVQDVKGAIDAGIGTTILVKTGKYRDGDETKLGDGVAPTVTCDSIVEAVDYILRNRG